MWTSHARTSPENSDCHSSNLRQKIERDPQDPKLVLTVRGVGYRLAEEQG